MKWNNIPMCKWIIFLCIISNSNDHLKTIDIIFLYIFSLTSKKCISGKVPHPSWMISIQYEADRSLLWQNTTLCVNAVFPWKWVWYALNGTMKIQFHGKVQKPPKGNDKNPTKLYGGVCVQYYYLWNWCRSTFSRLRLIKLLTMSSSNNKNNNNNASEEGLA